MADGKDKQGIGHYPGPNHPTIDDMIDWSRAHELGRLAAGGRRLLPPAAAGQLRELARRHGGPR
jgi:hypothetical protein